MKRSSVTSPRRSPSPTVHSLELKISIARDVIENGKRQSTVAGETGIALSNIHKWVKLGRSGALAGYTPPEFDLQNGDLAAEVKRLNRELSNMTMQRDFLKKVSAFFAKDVK